MTDVAKRRLWRLVRGRRYMRVRVGGGDRENLILSGPKTDDEADVRAALISDVVTALVQAGRSDRVKIIGDRMGAATKARDIDIARKAADEAIARGIIAPRSMTFADFARQWTDGALHKQFPDYVKLVDHANNISSLDKHIIPLIGPVPMVAFSLEDAELVMRKLPDALSASSRRHVAQIMYRLARVAVYPVKALKANPLPMGFLPKLGRGKEAPYLYPDEDAKLMACKAIPLERRLVYGVLAREGMRTSELIGRVATKTRTGADPLPWGALDLLRGTVNLEKNKTDDPRTWVLDAGVVRALKAWRELVPFTTSAGDQPVFSTLPNLARQLRADLDEADVKRSALGTRSAGRSWMKAHGLRATFVTLSLANGKTETWVADRTGHRSSIMINEYRRAARTAAELGLGELRPLDALVPELAKGGPTGGPTNSKKNTKGGRNG